MERIVTLMGDNAWIFIADKQSWIECAEVKSFGVEKAPGRLKPAQPGEACVAYVSGESVFAGVGRITSTYYYDETSIFEDGIFPHRVGIEVALDFDTTVDVRSLVDMLDFVTDKAHWSVFFRGGVARIPLSDFQIIESAIEKRRVATEVERKPVRAGETAEGIAQTISSLPELTASSLHDRIAEMIHIVGLRMGYDSSQRYKTRPDSPYQIDVVWLRDKNPQVAIEVHRGGILGDALDRLRHARDFNFRKVVLVVVETEDHKRALEVLKFDEKLKHVIDLWSAKSIFDMYSSCAAFHRLYRRFEESQYREQLETELL